MKTLKWMIFLLSAGFMLFSCEKEDGHETRISSYGSLESHNMGKNCMECHIQGGGGEGWFTVAGTVYDSLKTNPYPDATILLFTEPDTTGSVIHTIEGDGKGNFYTTEPVSFGNGLYPAVRGSGPIRMMSISITTGKCNSCHGQSTERIWIK